MYDGHSGTGSYILYQDITLPADQFQTLTLTAYYQNQYTGGFVTPNTLDYRTGANQQFRIDIVSPTGDLLRHDLRGRQTQRLPHRGGRPAGPRRVTVTADLGAFAGQTVRLRIAVTNNLNFLFGGVDDVHLIRSSRPVPSRG